MQEHNLGDDIMYHCNGVWIRIHKEGPIKDKRKNEL